MMFASKTPRDLNHDPAPMLDPYSGARYRAADEALGYGHFPRPEYDHPQHNQPNPILIDVRLAGRSDWSQMLRVFEYVTSEARHYVTADWLRITDDSAIDHARRVLTRLERLSKAVA